MHLGPKPEYGRWTYWEKFDYFAVFWGIFIIGSTGLTLWFPVFFTRFLPGAFINVATIIHSDEALLATGFIFTVHFFNTHLRPEKFPMDTTVFTGRMALAELKRDKRKEYDALVASGELEQHLAEPLPEIVVEDDPGLCLDRPEPRLQHRGGDRLCHAVRLSLGEACGRVSLPLRAWRRLTANRVWSTIATGAVHRIPGVNPDE